MFGGVRRQLGRLHDDCVSRRQSRNQFHANGYHRAVPGEDDPDDAIRLGHRVGELTLVGREGRDPPFDLVGPARVVRRPVRHDADERLAHARRHAVVEHRQPGDFVGVALHQLAEPTKDSCALRGLQARQVGYAAWAACTAASTSSGPASGTGPWISPRRRIHVVVHASRTTRTCLATDVQVHLGNGQVNAHRVVLRFEPGIKIHDLLVRHLTS